VICQIRQTFFQPNFPAIRYTDIGNGLSSEWEHLEMTFTPLYNQPKVPGVQDLWFEVLKMLSAIEALQRRQDVHSTLSNNQC